MIRSASALLAFAITPGLALADNPLTPEAKVPLAFNRLYDVPELEEALRKLVAAHPGLLTLTSLGKSVEGRDLWCVTINNPATGPDTAKPAMYADGNVHGNEVQASEACLYLIWYITENYPRVEKIRKIVDERAFYIVPTVNPDGRAWWFNGPNTTHSSRSGVSPLDDDRDGVADEDGYDDLNGDGQITQMRRKRAGGRYKVSPVDPRLMVPVTNPEEKGDYDLLGMEGIDNDGDSLVNEDPPGGYDMNRNYPADWQPDHIQGGAGPFPLCWPETRAIAQFFLDHPNIAGVQSFHNFGGMILRGPSHPSRQAQVAPEDDSVAKAIGEAGIRMLPHYRNMVIHSDLYPVRGGFVNWTYEHLGIFSFTNEIWNTGALLGKAGDGEEDALFANDKLMLGAQFVPWTKVRHPQYGDIEVGGFVKQSQRIPPPFLIEEGSHRNAAFVLYHADQMPRLEWEDVTFEPLGPGTFSVTAAVRNTRLIPSISKHAADKKIGRPDLATISGPWATVAAGGILRNIDTGEVELVERDPARIKLESGIAGGTVARVRWFIRGSGEVTVEYASRKGGTIRKTINLNP